MGGAKKKGSPLEKSGVFVCYPIGRACDAKGTEGSTGAFAGVRRGGGGGKKWSFWPVPFRENKPRDFAGGRSGRPSGGPVAPPKA